MLLPMLALNCSRAGLRRIDGTTGDNGKLGINQPDGNYSEPQFVTALAGNNVRFVVAGMQHVLALCQNGDLYAWGRSEGGVLGLGALPTYVAGQPVQVRPRDLRGFWH